MSCKLKGIDIDEKFYNEVFSTERISRIIIEAINKGYKAVNDIYFYGDEVVKEFKPDVKEIDDIYQDEGMVGKSIHLFNPNNTEVQIIGLHFYLHNTNEIHAYCYYKSQEGKVKEFNFKRTKIHKLTLAKLVDCVCYEVSDDIINQEKEKYSKESAMMLAKMRIWSK